MDKITEITIKALKILDVDWKDRMAARDFARKMWADSKAWSRVYNTGHGATSGKGMWLAGGSYLAKLKKRGLVDEVWDDYNWRWIISEKGRVALRAYKLKKRGGCYPEGQL